VSIAEYIGVRTTALQRRVQPVTVITTPLAGAHTGAPVLALVGTDRTGRSKAIGFKWRSGVCAPGRRAFRIGWSAGSWQSKKFGLAKGCGFANQFAGELFNARQNRTARQG
jgi:hypothetical protein